MAERILILGGGVTGCYLAAMLAERGKAVTLIERAGHLGGRAAAVRNARTSEPLEIGPHLTMGAYRATRRFAATVAAEDLLLFQDRLSIPFRYDAESITRFTCPSLPAPLHVAAGLLRFPALSPLDRLSGVWMGRELRQIRKYGTDHLDQITVLTWLNRCGQTDNIIRKLWEPLCVAALNYPIEKGSAKLFANVLVEAFCQSKEDSRIGWIQGGMGTLCDHNARLFIDRMNGLVFRQTRVDRLLFENSRVVGVQTNSSKAYYADFVVSTLAPWDLRALLDRSGMTKEEDFRHLDRFRPSPILTVTLWTDREITDEHFVYLQGGQFHWLFDNRRHIGLNLDSPPCYSFLISGPTPLLGCPKAELEEIAVKDLLSLFPEMAETRVLRSSVSRQRTSTYAPDWGMEKFRPGPQTTVPGLVLAGDWTATGLPATIESACRSAEAAANRLILYFETCH